MASLLKINWYFAVKCYYLRVFFLKINKDERILISQMLMFLFNNYTVFAQALPAALHLECI